MKENLTLIPWDAKSDRAYESTDDELSMVLIIAEEDVLDEDLLPEIDEPDEEDIDANS